MRRVALTRPVARQTTRFEGRVGIVTGGSRGIGLAIAQRLVSEGASLCVTGRDSETLQQVRDALGEAVVTVRGDVADAEHRDLAIQTTLEQFGRIDVLVNNVGVIGPRQPLTEVDPADLRDVLEVNCLVPLAWTAAVTRRSMQRTGSVVNVSSALGRITTNNPVGAYTASKAMLDRMTAQLAVELAPRVRVNAVAPGLVRTDLGSARIAGREQQLADTYPLGRLGEPSDVAATVAHLLSDDASWITGQSIPVDGGILITSAL